MKKAKFLLGAGIISLFLGGCAEVKYYDRAYLDDEEMQLRMRDCAHFEAYFESIREGAAGGGAGKTGGGCGCN